MSCKVTGKLFEVVNMLWEEQKMPREYDGQLLYHSEVIFLDAVEKFPKANVSSMSNLLKITKGAVTQLSSKLSQKGLIEIYTKDGNRKEKYFRLTREGKVVRREHLSFHENSNKRLCEYIQTLNPDEVKAIFDFLSRLKDCVPFCEFDCMCNLPNEGKDEYKNEPNAAAYQQAACNAGIR